MKGDLFNVGKMRTKGHGLLAYPFFYLGDCCHELVGASDMQAFLEYMLIKTGILDDKEYRR
jgi:hypothetical protein